MKNIVLILGVLLALTSCTKEPGEGGLASVKGRVMKEVRLVLSNPETALQTFPAPDEDVWIIYGENISPDDRVRTNFEGEFEVRFLRPGDYTLYVYSRDTTGQPDTSPNRMPIMTRFTIDGRRDQVDLGEIVIYDRP